MASSLKASGYHDTRVCREDLRLGTSLAKFLEDASRCGGDVVKGVFSLICICVCTDPYFLFRHHYILVEIILTFHIRVCSRRRLLIILL